MCKLLLIPLVIVIMEQGIKFGSIMVYSLYQEYTLAYLYCWGRSHTFQQRHWICTVQVKLGVGYQGVARDMKVGVWLHMYPDHKPSHTTKKNHTSPSKLYILLNKTSCVLRLDANSSWLLIFVVMQIWAVASSVDLVSQLTLSFNHIVFRFYHTYHTNHSGHS